MSENHPTSFFVPLGDGRYRATELTRGPWSPDTQHAGPPSALLAGAIEQHAVSADCMLARCTFDIYKPIPIGELEIDVRTLRPGRNVELVEATLTAEGETVMRGAAWRIRRQQDGVAAGSDEGPPPGPEGAEGKPFFPTGQTVGYHTGMEAVFVSGGFIELGPSIVWMRMRVSLVPDEEPSPVQRVLCAADSGNGVSAVLNPLEYVFINAELTVHLTRPLEGEWVCLDAVTTVEPNGVGLAASRIYDRRGRIGRGSQALYIAER